MKRYVVILLLSTSLFSQNMNEHDNLLKLQEQLQTASEIEQCYLIRQIGSHGAKASFLVPQLIKHLSSQDMLLQYSTIKALGEIGPAAAMATPKLIQILRNNLWSEYYINAAAIKTLASFKSEAHHAIKPLLNMLFRIVEAPGHRHSYNYSKIILHSLYAIVRDLSQEYFYTIFTDKNFSQQDHFTFFAHDIKLSEQESDAFVEKSQKILDIKIKNVLSKCLVDQREYVVKNALQVLRCSPKKFAQLHTFLAPLSQSADLHIRTQSVFALIEMEHLEFFTPFQSLLFHEDENIRKNALSVLANINTKKAASFVKPLVASDNQKISICAVKAVLNMHKTVPEYIYIKLLDLAQREDKVNEDLCDILRQYREKWNADFVCKLLQKQMYCGHILTLLHNREQPLQNSRIAVLLWSMFHDENYADHHFDILPRLRDLGEMIEPILPDLHKFIMLNHSKEQYQYECAEIIFCFYEAKDKAYKYLRQLFQHKDAELQILAITPLFFIPKSKVDKTFFIPLFVEMTLSKNKYTKRRALELLCMYDSAENCLPLLIKALADQEPDDGLPFVGYVQDFIVNIGVDAIPSLVKVLQRNDKQLIVLTLETIRRIQYEKDYDPGYPLQEDIGAIIRDKSTIALPIVEKLLYNKDEQIKLEAIKTLGSLLSPRVKSYLKLLQDIVENDPSFAVRCAALKALAKDRNANQALPLLLKLLEEKKFQSTVAQTLGEFDHKSSNILQDLMNNFAQYDLPTKKLLLTAIGRIGQNSPDIVPFLLQQINEQTHEQAISALALQKSLDANTVDLLRELENKYPTIQQLLLPDFKHILFAIIVKNYNINKVAKKFSTVGTQATPILLMLIENHAHNMELSYFAMKALHRISDKIAVRSVRNLLHHLYNKKITSPDDLGNGTCGTAFFRVSREYTYQKGLLILAIEFLAKTEDDSSKVIEMLRIAAKDREPAVRTAAVQALQQLEKD